jgi:hypothetical protein
LRVVGVGRPGKTNTVSSEAEPHPTCSPVQGGASLGYSTRVASTTFSRATRHAGRTPATAGAEIPGTGEDVSASRISNALQARWTTDSSSALGPDLKSPPDYAPVRSPDSDTRLASRS